ncbi:hypothetical protein RFI_33459, partial [Reticulomyxa filosa]
GRVGCANVLSDMYALGIVHIDNVLMILASSLEMKDEKVRNQVTSQMIHGFNDMCVLADTHVTGGQSVLNPWPIIGGVAQSVCATKDFIDPVNGQIGDVLVLTKPLGTQVAVNVKEWKMKQQQNWSWLKQHNIITDKSADKAFNIAVGSMIRLNRNGAILMHKYQAHGNI